MIAGRECERSPVIGVIGVTVTGNIGGVAMLEAVMDEARRRLHEPRFILFTVYPQNDAAAPTRPDLSLSPIPPLRLVPCGVAAALALGAGAQHLGVLALHGVSGRFVKDLQSCDAVFDLAGIAFSDKRGAAMLAYNVACCSPSFTLGRPHHKLAQALGPFTDAMNRSIARFVLSRCASVVARGERSAENLRVSGIGFDCAAPDVSFALRVTDEARRAARGLLNAEPGSAVVLISPSRVVDRLAGRAGLPYLNELAKLCAALVDSGRRVVILPHSMSDRDDKNDDRSICAELYARCERRDDLQMIDPPQDARVLRAVFEHAGIAVVSRFHAAVAAAASACPTVTIGWGHKYAEMLAPFGLDRFYLDWRDARCTTILEHVSAMEGEGEALRLRLQSAADDARVLASRGLDAAFADLCAHPGWRSR